MAGEKNSREMGSFVGVEDFDSKAERRLILKCDLHVVPILFVLFLLAFLDRINIGNARLQGLEKDLNMAGHDYNIALFVFFIPYILCEVPSNLILKHVAPSSWLSGIIVAWGRYAHICSRICSSSKRLCRDHHYLPRSNSKLCWAGCLPFSAWGF